MQQLRKLLLNTVKENCRTDLHKKFFLDWIGDWDYLSHYEATDECEIDRELAINDYIDNIASDSIIEWTLESLLESGMYECVTKPLRKNPEYLDYDTWYDKNYNDIDYNYKQELLENWYTSTEWVNDWRDEFCKKEYKIYLQG